MRNASPMRGNYLSRIKSEEELKECYWRSTNLICNVYFSAGCARRWKMCRVILTEISERGASIRTGKVVLPGEFYLVLGEKELVLGCVAVASDGGVMRLKFVRQIPGKLVNQISRLDWPHATLGKLFGDNGYISRSRRGRLVDGRAEA